MTHRRLIIGSLLFAALLGPAIGAEITPLASPSGETVHQAERFRLQCWQEGNKIVDVPNLAAMSVSPDTSRDVISFRRQGQQDSAVVVIPLNDGVCMTLAE